MIHAPTIKKAAKLVILNVCIVAALISVNSCKHDNFKDFVGPGVCPTSAFAVVSPFDTNGVSPTGINLTTTTAGLGLYAEYNESVAWSITITGQTSGAVKKYSGRSAIVDIHWRGEPGSNAVFFVDETVTVTHEVSCKDPQSIDVVVTHNNFTNYGVSNSGFLLTDFDTPLHNAVGVSNTTAKGYNASGWSGYVTPPAGDFSEFGVVSGPLTPAQGNGYLHIKGISSSTSWYCGGADAPLDLSSLASSNTPDQIYINMMINSNGNSTTLFAISLVKGTYPSTTAFTQLLPLNWSGWKMISIKLSDFKTKRGTQISPGLSGDMGLINTLDLGMNCASAMGQTTEANIDFIIFTVGAPLSEK